MFRATQLQRILVPGRNILTAAALKESGANVPGVAVTEEGFRLATLPQPTIWPGLSRIALVINAGSRYELDNKDRGITHLIRRSCGLSTENFTAVNMCRHFEQMGARVTCLTTREHMIYTVDCAPNLVVRAGYLLGEMATGPAFYHWELKSIANKLMLNDIDILNRRNLPALAMELLHEAAFGLSPSGSGLGHSTFASADRVGSYSLDQIEKFHQRYFTPERCTLSLVGTSSNEEGLEVLREIRSAVHARAPLAIPKKTGKSHGFVGGDIRRDLCAAPNVTAYIAWPTPGHGPNEVAFDLAACLLSGAVGRISYGGSTTQSYWNPSSTQSDDVQCIGFHKPYEGLGLFGLGLSGSSASAINDRLVKIIPSILGSSMGSKTLAAAKSLYKANLLMELESPGNVATDFAVQVSRPGHVYQTVQDRFVAVDKISVGEVNSIVQKTLTHPLAAMAVVGPEAGDILPLPVLLSA